MRWPILVALPPLLGGCLIRTAAEVATLPVKVVGAGVAAATTTQGGAGPRPRRALRGEESK